MKPALRCTYCHDALPRDEAAFCAACLAPQHAACRREHGRCAAPGCAEEGVVRPRRPLLAPRRVAVASPQRLAALTAGLAGVTGLAGLSLGLRAGEAAGAAAPRALEVRSTPAEDSSPPPQLTPPEPFVDAPGPLVSPPPPRRRARHTIELRGEGLTLPVELLPGERLVVVAAPTRLEVSRLCPLSLETQLLMITPRHAWTVAARLPGDDPAWLPVRGAPPHVIDLDPAVDAPRLRVRPAFARELRLLRDWPRAPGELEPDGTRDCLHEWKTRR